MIAKVKGAKILTNYKPSCLSSKDQRAVQQWAAPPHSVKMHQEAIVNLVHRVSEPGKDRKGGVCDNAGAKRDAGKGLSSQNRFRQVSSVRSFQGQVQGNICTNTRNCSSAESGETAIKLKIYKAH
ncbi:hypothetical protein CDAR_485921 [Caerostris darwini]|uniref:Uncharacterized protein n=1 Tax=Caerostris darwini TaxID=1538125 RepID=A0AAV4WIK9_9ARAC|nr:hypothetical protein CDAR_485921 [Caerostris darwini]